MTPDPQAVAPDPLMGTGPQDIENHRRRHIELHRCLDELVADWIKNGGGMPSGNTVMKLMLWSHGQTINPTGEDINE